MRRTIICLVTIAAAAAAAACSRAPAPQGPTAPMNQQILALDDSRLAGEARSTALAFLRAYAKTPSDDGRALHPLVVGTLAREWAHWITIQNAGFPGTIEGSLRLRYLGPAGPVRAQDGSLDNVIAYGVVVQATVTFTFTDDQGASPQPLQRLMDGLIVLVRGPDGAFRVLNFERDGRRLDEFFHVFDGAQERRSGVTVEIRNLVQLERWQFGVRVTNDTRGPLRVLPQLTALLTAAEQPATQGQPLVTFPRRIPSGESAEGIVSFTAPTATTSALDLQIAVAGPDGKPTGFVFAVPEPTATATPTASPSP